jgi:hypothetical protein
LPGEDDVSTAAHLQALQRECAKSHPDNSVIAEKMERTYQHRKSLVAAKDKKISDVLEIYPCLQVEKQVTFVLKWKSR